MPCHTSSWMSGPSTCPAGSAQREARKHLLGKFYVCCCAVPEGHLPSPDQTWMGSELDTCTDIWSSGLNFASLLLEMSLSERCLCSPTFTTWSPDLPPQLQSPTQCDAPCPFLGADTTNPSQRFSQVRCCPVLFPCCPECSSAANCPFFLSGDVIEVYYGDNRFGTMTDSGTATLKPRPRVRPLLTFLPLVSVGQQCCGLIPRTSQAGCFPHPPLWGGGGKKRNGKPNHSVMMMNARD